MSHTHQAIVFGRAYYTSHQSEEECKNMSKEEVALEAITNDYLATKTRIQQGYVDVKRES